MRRAIHQGRVAVCFAALVLAGLGALALPPSLAQEPRNERRYADGPLAIKDFQMEVPKPLPTVTGGLRLHASTFTELRYNYHYSFEQVGARFTAKATSLEFYSSLVPDKSWNSRPEDARLLDHEQGHFDITELNSWRAQKRLGKLLADGAFQGVGASEVEARDKMLVIVGREFQKHMDEMRDEQTLYDRSTSHGTDREVQSQWRRKINEQLATVAEERKNGVKPPEKGKTKGKAKK